MTSSRFIVFGVKGLLQASKNVRGSMLFNILSYMSDHLLTIGNTTAALDELYVWLSDNVSVGTTIIEYIRNTLKRVRKKESNLIMASQNLEDFDREGIRGVDQAPVRHPAPPVHLQLRLHRQAVLYGSAPAGGG